MYFAALFALLKKACVRQVVLDEWFPLSGSGLRGSQVVFLDPGKGVPNNGVPAIVALQLLQARCCGRRRERRHAITQLLISCSDCWSPLLWDPPFNPGSEQSLGCSAPRPQLVATPGLRLQDPVHVRLHVDRAADLTDGVGTPDPQLHPRIISLETRKISYECYKRHHFTKLFGLGSGVPIPSATTCKSPLLDTARAPPLQSRATRAGPPSCPFWSFRGAKLDFSSLRQQKEREQ